MADDFDWERNMLSIYDKFQFQRVIFQGEEISKEMIYKEAEELAAYLENGFASKSPFVHLTAFNHVKTLVAYLAIVKSGRTCVWHDPFMTALEKEDINQDAPPAADIRIDPSSLKFSPESEVAFTSGVDPKVQSDLSDVALILYSGAEEGRPKGVLITQKNVETIAGWISQGNSVNEGSTTFAMLPFHHVFGLVVGFLAPGLTSSSTLIHDITDLRRMGTIVKDIVKYEVSHIYSVPLLYFLLCRNPELKEIFKDVYTCSSAGIKVDSKVFRYFERASGKTILEGYGLTETTTTCTWHMPDMELRYDSVGKNFMGSEFAILGKDQKLLGPDEQGEILIQGDHVTKGYLNRPEETEKAFFDGYLRTGDLGHFDRDGYLYFDGLIKEMLNVNGNNVYPKEVERLIGTRSPVRWGICSPIRLMSL
jgi:long-chain acyl-CoA synthetase